jgi:hypothetical protein
MQIKVAITFKEYKKRRAAGEFEGMTETQALMKIFEEKGIKLNKLGMPKQPAEIETDKANQQFVITQGKKE